VSLTAPDPRARSTSLERSLIDCEDDHNTPAKFSLLRPFYPRRSEGWFPQPKSSVFSIGQVRLPVPSIARFPSGKSRHAGQRTPTPETPADAIQVIPRLWDEEIRLRSELADLLSNRSEITRPKISGTRSDTGISSPDLWQTPLNYGPDWI